MTDIRADCAIVGGGIAGLWLLNVVQARGLQTVLVERAALGAGQTLAAQGVIHGGIKYHLGGSTNAAPATIAGMPARWRKHLAGAAAPALDDTALLSKHFYLWSNAALTGRLGSFLASRALSGSVERLPRARRPEVFRDPAFGGDVYQLSDFVVDSAALLAQLAAGWSDRVFLGDARAIVSTAPTRHRLHVDIGGASLSGASLSGASLSIACSCVLLCAGEGNARFAPAMPGPPTMQLRPLHQVLVTAAALPPLFGHCVTGLPAAGDPEPRLTVTSHTWGDRRVWAVGGALASTGVDCSPVAQVARARAELNACLPWLHLDDARFATLRIDRAEAAGPRRNGAFVSSTDGVLHCWPTKLTLAPDLADQVVAALDGLGVRPAADVNLNALASLPRPQVGAPPWAAAAWT